MEVGEKCKVQLYNSYKQPVMVLGEIVGRSAHGMENNFVTYTVALEGTGERVNVRKVYGVDKSVDTE